MPTFVERLDRRARAWWGTDSKRDWVRTPSVLARFGRRIRQPHLAHRLREVFVLRRRDDPDEVWRCCPHWRRTLGNKWNSRLFAERYGVRVPDLYWSGRFLARAPWTSLPSHYVVRPSFSDSRRGTYVMADGVDLLRAIDHGRDGLEPELRQAGRWRTLHPTLIEEFVRTEDGRYALPREYKCYMFAGVLASIEVVLRGSGGQVTQSYYSAAWQRQPLPLTTLYPEGPDIDPPRCLDEIVDAARRLGAAYGTFVRVDLYASDRGCVFGEFSSRPQDMFTPESSRYLGDLWNRYLPADAI
jgi:hypothetical protein